MLLTAYKINNVIKAYGEQLRQELSSHVKKTDAKPAPNRIDVSARTRRKGTIEKIISCVVERITRCADHEPVEKDLPHNLNNEGGAPPPAFD